MLNKIPDVLNQVSRRKTPPISNVLKSILMVFPIWQVWEYSIIPTQHLGGSGISYVQNYSLETEIPPPGQKLQLSRHLRRATETQGHNSWPLAEVGLRPRSPGPQAGSENQAAREGQKPPRQEPGAGGGPPNSSHGFPSGESPPWFSGRWPWPCFR